MSEDANDLAERALNRRKREDSALVLPLIGVALLASPILNIFTGGMKPLGLPISYLYIFLVWVGLILLVRALTRRLMGPGEG